MVAGHSDVASFLNCRSSANFFAAMQMNEIKLKKPFSAKLDVARLIMISFHFFIQDSIFDWLCSHALTQFFSEA